MKKKKKKKKKEEIEERCPQDVPKKALAEKFINIYIYLLAEMLKNILGFLLSERKYWSYPGNLLSNLTKVRNLEP